MEQLNITLAEHLYDGNWVIGYIDSFRFMAKVYDEPSKYGLNGGKISKLCINGILDYERGWQVTNKAAEPMLNQLVAFLEKNTMKWFLEMVQCTDGSYYANLRINNVMITDLPEYVDYNTVKNAIENQYCITILLRKDMKFEKGCSGGKKYAYLDGTRQLDDMRITMEQMLDGYTPNWD